MPKTGGRILQTPHHAELGLRLGRLVQSFPKFKILQIGNYPPPYCGWAVQTKLLVEEIRKRGHICEVLNINENRKKMSSEYVDVQNAFDYLQKVIQFALKGYRFQVHVNGQSKPGYILALVASLVGRLTGNPVALSWRGGLQQRFFPRPEDRFPRWAFQVLFRLAGKISCNNIAIKQAIMLYGVEPEKVAAIPGFSSRHLMFTETSLSEPIEAFLRCHRPVFFCYVSFRPEYDLPILREAMLQFRRYYPGAGFIWLGFPEKELPLATAYANQWPAEERAGLLLLGNLSHDQFLTLLRRSSAYVRTPVCDGVSASILEALTLGVPVVGSDNGQRPGGVMTFRKGNAADLCAKLLEITGCHPRQTQRVRSLDTDDNIAKTVDWVLGPTCGQQQEIDKKLVHAQ